jgi:serine/threonine protein kinase
MPQPTSNGPLGEPAEAPLQASAATTSDLGGTQEHRPVPQEVFPRPFGRYELRALLGRGGMGTVYLAHDPQLDRLIALKVPRLVGEEGDVWRLRFQVEARAAATLQHPNICPVHEVGEVDSQPYLTMAYIEGESLAARLKRSPLLPIREAVQLVHTLAGAMAEAHQRGIVHRDLKPANVMMDRRGQPMVMDFGLALRPRASDDLRLTLSGLAVGTPAYMPPEQAGGDNSAIGPPTDVYALGVILYELLTGRAPFRGSTFGKLVAQIERDPPPAPSGLNPAIDSVLESILLKALAKAPEDRFGNAAVFAAILDAYLLAPGKLAEPAPEGSRRASLGFPSEPPTASAAVRLRRAVAAGLIGLVVLGLLGGFLYVQTDYGDLVVEMSDPRAKVEVKVNGHEVTLDPSGKPVRIRAGRNQKLEVSGSDYESVSESFNLIRNGKAVVRVKLKPRKPVEEASESRVEEPPTSEPTPTEPPKKDPPKPVAFPLKPTAIEASGWLVFADAGKDQMKKWLAQRKKAGHSVLWLDAAEVAGKPLFCAVAAADDRAGDWHAFLDVPAQNFRREAEKLPVDIHVHQFASVSGYLEDESIKIALLVHPVVTRWQIYPDVVRTDLAELKKITDRQGFSYRLFRPYPSIGGAGMFAVVTELAANRGLPGLDLTAEGLEKFADDERKKDRRLTGVAGCVVKGRLLFAAVAQRNRKKQEWSCDHGLTAGQLESKSREKLAKGFRPETVTAYPWDGAVRYGVVWIKEPPKRSK